MKLQDLAGMFNRSWNHAFSIRKFVSMFLVLVLAGLITVFFYGLSFYTVSWFQIGLRFIPLFIGMGLLMAVGAFLIKDYETEKSGSDRETVQGTFTGASRFLTRSFTFALPLLGAFLAMWILLGIFVLLKFIPYVGLFFGVVLAFVPFLLNLSILLLLVAALGSLFFFTPLLPLHRKMKKEFLSQRMESDLFSHLITFFVSLIPLWIGWALVKAAAGLTFEVYQISEKPIALILQSFFVLIPVAAVMALPFIFFFNFAQETFLWKEGGNKLPEENVSPDQSA